jgi:hypothetical protein
MAGVHNARLCLKTEPHELAVYLSANSAQFTPRQKRLTQEGSPKGRAVRLVRASGSSATVREDGY